MASFDVMGRLGMDYSEFQSSAQTVLGQLDKVNSAFDALAGVAMGAGIAVGGAFAGVAVAAFDYSNDVSKAQDQIAGAFGMAREGAAGLTEEMQEVWGAGFGENVEEATAAVIEVRNQMKLLAEDEISDATIAATKLGNADIQGTTAAANLLMEKFGLTSQQSFDFLAKGFQSGLDASGDFLDSITEYGGLFADSGYSATQMFSIFETGQQAGVLGVDKIGDAMKELGIILNAGGGEVAEAFDTIGLNYDQISASVASGDEAWADYFDKITGGLQGIEDPLKRNQVQVALFGTMAEDMGQSFAQGLSDASTSLDDMAGSMDTLDVKYQSFGAVGEQIKRQLIMSLQPLGDEMLAAVNASMPQVQEGFAWFSEQLPLWIADGQSAVSGFILEITSFVGVDTAQFTSGWDAIPILFTEIKTVVVDNKDSIIGAMQGIGVAFAIAGTVTAVGAAIAALTNPITLLIGASAALGVAWSQDWGGIQGKTEVAWNMIKPIFDAANTALTVTLPQAMFIMRTGWEQDWGGVRTTIEAGWNAVNSAFGAANTALTVTLPQAMFTMRTGWEQDWGGVRTTIEAGWEIIAGIFDELYIFAAITIPNGLIVFAEQWTTVWSGAFDFVSKLWDKVSNFIDWIRSLSVPNPFDWGPEPAGADMQTTEPDGFAKGTSYAPGGFAFIAEAGPELIISSRGQQVVSRPSFGYLERGAQVKSASETSQMLSSQATVKQLTITNHNYFYGSAEPKRIEQAQKQGIRSAARASGLV